MRLFKNTKIGKENGYTAVELLTVIVVIGILAAIAIPNYNSYKARSYDTAAKSDLYNLYATCVGHWTEKTNAVPCSMAVATSASYGFISTDGVLLTLADDSHANFQATSTHASSSKTFEIGPEGYIGLQ